MPWPRPWFAGIKFHGPPPSQSIHYGFPDYCNSAYMVEFDTPYGCSGSRKLVYLQLGSPSG